VESRTRETAISYLSREAELPEPWGFAPMRGVALEWVNMMQASDSLTGMVLVCAGLGFLLAGWRFARIAILFSYGFVGAAGGYFLGRYYLGPLPFAAGLALVSIGLGYFLKRYAAPTLAALLGSLTLWAILGPTTVPAPTIYIVLTLAFVAVFIFSISHVRETTVVMTSFIGAIFIVSGIVAMASSSSTFGPHYRSMSAYGLFYPFLLIVPTVSGILIQLGDARSQDSGAVRG
jgi:hypothetical protein